MEQPSSSSSPNPKPYETAPPPATRDYYDVFLSFSGEDTGYGFTDHLYHALNQKGFSVFRDSEKLLMPGSVSERAIRKSKFAVIVFSPNYVISTRCRDELVRILRRKDTDYSEILPVFYHVESTEIRSEIRGYWQPFHDDDDTRTQLQRIDDLCSLHPRDPRGWHIKHDRSESEVVQEIVNQIYRRKNNPYTYNTELVGMDARIEEIESHLNLTSNEVLTLGIWGMGGIGKTTLANKVFRKISCQFDRCGFVNKVRKKSAVELQQCLCEIFLGKHSTKVIDTVEKGIRFLKKALCKRKVLIILDDVDCFKQIECLAPGGQLGEQIWSPGSRLIITTRDRRLLRHLNVKVIIEVEKLSDDEASQLLCQKAFKNHSPPEKFVELSKSFIQYAGGLPLAHKVLGSYLFNLEVENWSHILHKLDNDQDKELFGVLQTSFDGLQDTEKNIFLDIACFFNGEDYVRVKNILKACGFASGIGINNLIDKSLLKVEKNKLWMHGLLQSLGWHIVHSESPSPGKRSRLWVNNSAHKHKDSGRLDDVREVLIDNMGTAAVESLLLSLPEKEEISLTVDPFLKMRKLRLLKIYNVNFLVVNFGHFSRNLRLLEWHDCPLQSFPKNFMSVKLVEIRMPNSSIEHLWNDKLSLGMLTLMDLSHCRYLATTPDFTTVPNLERLILEGCNELPELHCTVWDHQRLKFLNLKGCKSIQSLPQSISMRSLQIFILSGCSGLLKFPEIWENMHTLSELHLDWTAISEIPLSIQQLTGLILLNLSGCKNLLSLPSILCSSLTSLKFLYLSLCSSMNNLPDNIYSLEHLEELDACNTAISELPQSISLLKNLKLLCLRGCSGLQLPNKFSGLSSLTTLNLGGCNLAEGAIPDDIGDLKSLQSLDLSANNFFTIPESICHLSALTEIYLFKCSKLQSLPKDSPSTLRKINLYGCSVLTYFPSSWARYPRPNGLSIPNCRKPEDDEFFTELHKTEEPDSPSPSSSSLPSDWEYDVFLSFRGDETDHGFTDSLYKALCMRDIDVFFRSGNSNALEYLKAIDDSQSAIIILSPNYATSTLCLDELAYVHGCKKVTGLQVFPVFYNVEPYEVRKPTGKYGRDFALHEKNFGENICKVQNWRQALKEIASITAGWHVKYWNDSRVIEEITEKISNNLQSRKRSLPPDRCLIGMDARVEELVAYLNLGSEEVVTVGVLGMGGVGKTTLAKEVYREIRDQFHTSGFVCNDRLQSEIELQQLVCESFMGDDYIGTIEKGSKDIRLSNQKVLLVLDNVDGLNQIRTLVPGGSAGVGNLWGPGSRILITTRDRSILTELGILEDKIYEVEQLSYKEASELFCQKVFRNVNPPKEFVDLSKSFLKYAGGLPLAHEVLGSHLSGRNADEWSEVLHRLDKDPHEDIFRVFQICFDGLHPSDKSIFLYIACFFNGEDYARVRNILNGCGISSRIGINNLVEKSLIKIEKGILWMPDLLRQLVFKNISRDSHFLEARSRLWSDETAHYLEARRQFEDARNVLTENTGTTEKEEIQLNSDPFVTMSEPRLLKICNGNLLDVCLPYQSKELRLFEWHECPLESLSSCFTSGQPLVEIKIPKSLTKILWHHSVSELNMLVHMDLSYCRYITRIPDLNVAPNLETLILEGCTLLSEVCQSAMSLQHLVVLNLKGCVSLKKLPVMADLRSIRTLIFSGCTNLREFPDIKVGGETLKELYLDGTGIEDLRSGYFDGLTILNLSGCKNLRRIPFPSRMKNLRFLYLSSCSMLQNLSYELESLEHLEELDLCDTATEKVPKSLSSLKNLKLLCFHGCSNLSVPLGDFPSLPSLTTLNLGRCNLIDTDISYAFRYLSSLQSLDLSENNNLSSIPGTICSLRKLKEISLRGCANLSWLSDDTPPSLQNVDIRDCKKLPERVKWSNLASDAGLRIRNCPKWDYRRPLTSLSVKFDEFHETPYPLRTVPPQ